MITDTYTDQEAESLAQLGYEACTIGDLVEGDEVAFKESASSYEEWEGTRINFFTVRHISRSATHYDGALTGNYVINISAAFDRFTKPLSFGDSWGCYRKTNVEN